MCIFFICALKRGRRVTSSGLTVRVGDLPSVKFTNYWDCRLSLVTPTEQISGCDAEVSESFVRAVQRFRTENGIVDIGKTLPLYLETFPPAFRTRVAEILHKCQ